MCNLYYNVNVFLFRLLKQCDIHAQSLSLIGRKRFDSTVMSGNDLQIQCCDSNLCNHGNTSSASGSGLTTEAVAPTHTAISTHQSVCSSNPCIHGKCFSGSADYFCQCDQGWQGMTCDQHQGPCTGSPCDHGRCFESGNDYLCQCENGWQGKNCDQYQGPCTGIPCVHGRCFESGNDFACQCENGWQGKNCDQHIDECLQPHPCGEHAVCENIQGSHKCSCPSAFPQGNAFLGCFEPVIISFETNGTRFNGDNEILDTFQIPNRFPYFGTYYTLFRPSLDGFISLDFQPLYNQYGGETPSEWTAAIQKHIVIAPLWTNIDSRNISGGGLWIHVFTEKDTTDVEQIQSLVRTYTNQTEFNVSVALVATWKHVTIHSPYEPGYELVTHQNLSMQVIIVTDGMYTYIMFNYDREQFSIRPLPEVAVASGYTHLDYSGTVISTRFNFTNLNKKSNVYPAFPGRWLYNVTYITTPMWNETRCLQFVKENNNTLKSWIQEQLVFALHCPCNEVLMLEDIEFTRKDEIQPGIGTKFTDNRCYESWFFSAYGIKQRCCYMFSNLQSQYPGAVAAEFENETIASKLQEGYYQCCSPDGSQKYCPLYQTINPPDDCSRYPISDEIQLDDRKDSPEIEDVSLDVDTYTTNPRNRVKRKVQNDDMQGKSESNGDSFNDETILQIVYRNLKKMFKLE